MILCKIETVIFDETSQMGVVILTFDEGKKTLPIWVGLFEAQSILMKLDGTIFPRPLTHDLFKTLMDTLNIKIEYVLINDILKSTYYAQFSVVHNGKNFLIDSRPSDAIAIALRANVPIFVSEKVVEVGAINREEFFNEQKEKIYKAFLEAIPDEELRKQ